MRAKNLQGNRVEINPLHAEAALKKLMTEVWNAGGGRLSVETCVDEAIRLGRETWGLEVPLEWRDRFVKAAKEKLEVRAKTNIDIEISDKSRSEFETEVAAAEHRAEAVIANPGPVKGSS